MNFAAWRPKKKFPIQINPIREFRMDGKGIMVNSVYRKGADYLPSDAEVAKLRPKE